MKHQLVGVGVKQHKLHHADEVVLKKLPSVVLVEEQPKNHQAAVQHEEDPVALVVADRTQKLHHVVHGVEVHPAVLGVVQHNY